MGTKGGPLMGSEMAGSSAVFGPDGRQLTASYTKNGQMIFADISLDDVVKAKTFADASGSLIRGQTCSG